MGLTEKLNQISELMKQTKQDWVASKPESTDLAIYLHFWRGEDLVAMVQTPVDRDLGLEAGKIGASGFGATTLSLTFESYHSTLPMSPVTDRPWQPREMQYVFEAVPQNLEKHWVSECLTTTVHERGGGFALHTLPYKIVDDQLVWGEEIVVLPDGDVQGGGAMHAYLQDAMSQPTIEEIISAKGDAVATVAAFMSGLVTDPEARLFHTDMATYTILKQRDLVTAIMFTAEAGSDRAKWIEERLGPGSLQP